MRNLFLIFIFNSFSFLSPAQNVRIANSIGYDVVQQAEKNFPKFYREFQYIKVHDSLIRRIAFIDEAATGPALLHPIV